MISVLKTKNRKPKRLLPVVLSVLIVSMCFSQIIPQTVEAAKKKPAVKSVVLKVNGKKVTKKTIKVNRGSKVKVQVVVNPTKAKKSVKWSKLSKKQKKIATMKGNTITAKKNGTIKLTVKVKGKNGKTKSAWMKVKVVTPSKKPATTKPSLVEYSVVLQSGSNTQKLNFYNNKEVTLPNPKNWDTMLGNGYEFKGWYTSPNGGGTKVTKIAKGNTANKDFYAYWVEKQASVTQNPTTYQEALAASIEQVRYAWIECKGCKKKYSFIAKGKTITGFIQVPLKDDNKYYALPSGFDEVNVRWGTANKNSKLIDITNEVKAAECTHCTEVTDAHKEAADRWGLPEIFATARGMNNDGYDLRYR